MSTRLKVILAIAVLWIAVAMIRTAASNSEPCIVTATAQKLCGDDARAWCSATDALRNSVGGGSVAEQMAAESSQSACDTIRGY